MKTIEQLTQNMLIEQISSHTFDAPNFIQQIILPDYDKHIETYNFKNKSLSPIGAAELLAEAFKASPALARVFKEAKILCSEDESQVIYFITFDLTNYTGDLNLDHTFGTENTAYSHFIQNNILHVTVIASC